MNNMRKPIISKFEVLPTARVLMKIQEQAHKYKDEYKESNSKNAADAVLLLYAQISFDEGYRENIKDTQKLMILGTSLKAKNRKKGWFEYIDDGDIEKVLTLAKKRIASKSLRKSQLQHWKEQGREWSEELFVLAMIMHTFFEAGYLKAETLEEQAKIICGKNAETVFDIVKQIIKDELSKEF
jgi:hypothetical protein